MKKITFLILSCSLIKFCVAQQPDEAAKLIREGIQLHDEGKFEDALVKYDQALTLDKDNLTAMSEKAMTLMATDKPEDAVAICQKAIETHAADEKLKHVYLTAGNAYDQLKQPTKAIQMYDKGIALAPKYYQLYFNKAVTLAGLQRYDDAVINFQQAVKNNPKHASSHNGIARLMQATNKRVPAVLAYCRHLAIEHQGSRATQNLVALQGLMQSNVEKTGKNSITMTIDESLLEDTESGVAKENNFATADMLLTMTTAMDSDKKYRKENDVERFIRKFESLCSVLDETKKDNHGFFWEYYAPYFIDMKQKSLIEPFAYIAFSSGADAKVTQWLNDHKDEVERFNKWSDSFAWIQ